MNDSAAHRLSHTAELALRGATLRLTWARSACSAPPILSLDGEYDTASVAEIDRFLRRQLGPLYHQDDLIIDLDGATFVDSSFMGFVAGVVRDQRAKRKELVLAHPRGQVRRALALVGLPNWVPVYESVEEAIVALVYGRTPLIPPSFNAVSA